MLAKSPSITRDLHDLSDQSSNLQFVTGKLSPRELAAQSAEPARQVSHVVLTSNMIYMIYAARAPDLMTLRKNVGLRAQTSKAEN
jgi:hypothetical protein